MDIEGKSIDGEHFADIHEKTARNADLAEFYDNLYADTEKPALIGRAQAIRVCCQWWDSDYYKMQNVKDIKRVNLCRDRFCLNCQSMLAIKRQGKYAPKLDELYDDYTVCHMVVTVPNCEGDELPPMLWKMYGKFQALVRYLDGRAHVRGMDFYKFGYAGALRALEVTYNHKTRFHPHFHCMVLFRKGLRLDKKYKNKFSFDEGQEVRKFSALEITLQKVWRLLIDGNKVTREAVQELGEGYSVIIDPIAKGEYHEVFKYACKGAFDPREGAPIYDEGVFRALYYSLRNRRMIQGYGILHNFKDEEGKILEEDLQANYAEMVAELQAVETPVFRVETLQEILRETKQKKPCKYVSRSNLKRLLIERKKAETKEREEK